MHLRELDIPPSKQEVANYNIRRATHVMSCLINLITCATQAALPTPSPSLSFCFGPLNMPQARGARRESREARGELETELN